MNLLSDIFTLSLITWGVSALFDEGMVLGWLGDWLEARVSRNVLKPIFACPACMSSVWGAGWALYNGYSVEQWLTVTFAVCGLNFLIMKFLSQ